jgi:hypothetical protein
MGKRALLGLLGCIVLATIGFTFWFSFIACARNVADESMGPFYDDTGCFELVFSETHGTHVRLFPNECIEHEHCNFWDEGPHLTCQKNDGQIYGKCARSPAF